MLHPIQIFEAPAQPNIFRDFSAISVEAIREH